MPELRDEIQALKDEKSYLQAGVTSPLVPPNDNERGNISGSKGISTRSTGELSDQKLPAGVRSDWVNIRVAK